MRACGDCAPTTPAPRRSLQSWTPSAATTSCSTAATTGPTPTGSCSTIVRGGTACVVSAPPSASMWQSFVARNATSAAAFTTCSSSTSNSSVNSPPRPPYDATHQPPPTGRGSPCPTVTVSACQHWRSAKGRTGPCTASPSTASNSHGLLRSHGSTATTARRSMATSDPRSSPTSRRSAATCRPRTLIIPLDEAWSEMDKPGWIVDGQQRCAAIREARVEHFPVCVTAFITDSDADQRSQFILVNSTKPLPKGLIYELLPATSGTLPTQLQVRRFPAYLLERLNHDPGSPLYRLILTPTTPEGVIKDNSVLKMLEHSIS